MNDPAEASEAVVAAANRRTAGLAAAATASRRGFRLANPHVTAMFRRNPVIHVIRFAQAGQKRPGHSLPVRVCRGNGDSVKSTKIFFAREVFCLRKNRR